MTTTDREQHCSSAECMGWCLLDGGRDCDEIRRDGERRDAYTSGLRKLADLLDQHPDLPLPSVGRGGGTPPVRIDFFGDDAREAMAAAARAIPGPLTKRVWGDGAYFALDAQLDGLTVALDAERDVVCERVVTGTRKVTKTVPDPAVVVPMVEVTETVEDVEWRCGSVLAGADQ